MGLFRLLTKSSPLAGTFFYNVSMFINKNTSQISMEFVNIEELVPSDHLLRKIDKVIDFDLSGRKSEAFITPTTVVLQLVQLIC